MVFPASGHNSAVLSHWKGGVRMDKNCKTNQGKNNQDKNNSQNTNQNTNQNKNCK